MTGLIPQYNPQYTNTNDRSVRRKVNEITSENSPLMRQAAHRGVLNTHRRGLLSSSLSAGAAQDAVIRQALPMASQESAQQHDYGIRSNQIASDQFMQGRTIASQEGMHGRGLEHENLLQQRDLDSRRSLLDRELDSRAGLLDRELDANRDLTAQEIAARRDIARMDIGSRENIAGMNINAQQELLATELGSRERLSMANIAAEKQLMGMQLTSNEQQALADRNAAMERLQAGIGAEAALQTERIGSNEDIARIQQETQVYLQQMSNDIQTQINQMNINSQEKQYAASTAAAFEGSYSSEIAAIMANPDLPRDVREDMINAAGARRDSNLALVEQMYGIALEWETTVRPPEDPEAPPPIQNNTPSATTPDSTGLIYPARQPGGINPN